MAIEKNMLQRVCKGVDKGFIPNVDFNTVKPTKPNSGKPANAGTSNGTTNPTGDPINTKPNFNPVISPIDVNGNVGVWIPKQNTPTSKDIYQKELPSSGKQNEVVEEDAVEDTSSEETKTIEDILGQYINSTDPSKSGLAGSVLDQYKSILDNTLNAKNEAYQAQQNAMKYSENKLRQMGLETSGYAQGANQNISNTYMNALKDINANKMSEERKLLNDYREGLATIEEKAKKEADSYNANVINNAESLLQYYLNDESKLNEYMERVMSDSNLSESTKTYIQDYLDALLGLQEEVEPNTWKTDRNSSLSNIKTYIDKNSIEGYELSDDQQDELKTLYNSLLNAKDEKETQAITDEIDTFVEEFIYSNAYSAYDTKATYAEDFNKATGDGSKNNPYVIEGKTKEDISKMGQAGTIPLESWVMIDGTKYIVQKVKNSNVVGLFRFD